MEYLREGLTTILDRLKMQSDLLATARMQVSTVRQATNDVILLTVHCFMVGQEDQWNYSIEISSLDIAQTAGIRGGLARLLEHRAAQALDALDRVAREYVEILEFVQKSDRVAREYVEILEFVQKSDREEPAPEIPKSVPYDIVRGAAELPEREPWMQGLSLVGESRPLSTREVLEAIYDSYAESATRWVADNVTQNNALLGMLRSRAEPDRPQSATESRFINQEIMFLGRPVYITGLDFAARECVPGDVTQSEGRLYRAVRTGISEQEFAGVYDQDPSRAVLREANPTIPDDVIDSWRVCAAMRGGHQFKPNRSCRKCGYYAPRHRQPRRRNRM